MKRILIEPAPFFESMVRQLEEYSEMKQMLKAVLFQGKRVSYNLDLPAVSLVSVLGYIINAGRSIQVANRIWCGMCDRRRVSPDSMWRVSALSKGTVILLLHSPKDDWHYVLGRLRDGRIAPGYMITHRFPLEELDRGLAVMRDKKEEYGKVMAGN